MVQAGPVKSFNPFDIEQVAVGDHAGDRAGATHAADDVVEVRMGQRLAAGDADHGRSETPQVVDAAVHLFEGDGLGNLVVLVAVGAAEVAESRRHDLRQHRMSGRGQGARHHRVFARLPGGCYPAAARGRSPGNGHLFY